MRGHMDAAESKHVVCRSKLPPPPEYTYFLVRTEDFRHFAIQNMTGSSGRQPVPASCFNTYEIIIHPSYVSKMFGDTARVSIAAMKQNDEQSRTLAEIRDTLLPKLMSGEVRVKQAEKVVEAAL